MSNGSDHERAGGHITWVVTLLGVLVIYVLSPGPVSKLRYTGKLPKTEEFGMFMHSLYYPLDLLHENVPAVKEFYDWWFRVCGM